LFRQVDAFFHKPERLLPISQQVKNLNFYQAILNP
jgi:hypothetical protein